MNFHQFLNESKKVQIKDFLSFTQQELNLPNIPKIIIIDNPEFSKIHKTFACFKNNPVEIKIQVANRHILDIYRSLAHELVHYSQMCNGQELNGEDGSKCENEANAMAGILLRKYTKNIKDHGY